MKKGILIAYGELFLKSDSVKKLFVNKLDSNVRSFLAGIDYRLTSDRDRMFITTNKTAKVKKILANVFGLAWFAESYCFKTEKELLDFIKTYQKNFKKTDTFAIRMKHNRDLIDQAAKLIKNKVDLNKPQKELFIEKRKNGIYLYFKKIKAGGGLPVGSSGKVLSLVSGGIDSVPAAYLAVKRGAETVWLHFHSFPLVSNKSIEKVKDLAEIFSLYQDKPKIYFVPFSEIQTEIKAKVEPKYRVLLYRRLMYKIAEQIAQKEGCAALVTGECLAQVSSQTPINLNITEEGIKIPVLRPLIGFDKEEIIKVAKKIGTFDISIRPQEDCCTLFVPGRQTAKGNLEIVRELEKKIESKKMIKRGLTGFYA